MSQPSNKKRGVEKDQLENKLHSYSPTFTEIKLNQNNMQEVNRCNVPITFRHLSELVDELLRDFKSHSDLLTDENKLIYKKVCFILAEIKLYRSSFYTRPGHLKSINGDTRFHSYRHRNISVPYLLALYLNSIGCFTNQGKNYIPVPAETENPITDACYSCMPYMFTDVLNQLANGVEIEKVPVKARESLKSLPAIDWDMTKNETHIRLKPESVEFWLNSKEQNAPENQLRELKFTSNDFSIFNNINNVIRKSCCCKLFDDFTESAEGNASQLVRFEELHDPCNWYTMHHVPNYLKKLGIVFGFGHFEEKVQASIAIGDFRTAQTVGQTEVKEYLRRLNDSNKYKMSRSINRNRREEEEDLLENKVYSYSPKFTKIKLNQYTNTDSRCYVPITFRHLSGLVDELLIDFKDFNRHLNVFTDENKLIYKKVCFILAEIKLYRSSFCTGPGHLKSIIKDTRFHRYFHENISVPYPLALYLNSIGRFTNQGKNYIPVPAITENHITDACYSCMPYTFTNVLNQLANGVEIEKVPVEARESLKSLPVIDWVTPKNEMEAETHIRLAPKSVEFWLNPKEEHAPKDQLRELKFTSKDFSIFNKINNVIKIRCGTKLFDNFTTDGEGNASQLVRLKGDRNLYNWYTMYEVPDYLKKLGILFGFGHFEKKVQASIAIGDFETTHTWGPLAVQLYMLSELVLPIRKAEWKRQDENDSDYSE